MRSPGLGQPTSLVWPYFAIEQYTNTAWKTHSLFDWDRAEWKESRSVGQDVC